MPLNTQEVRNIMATQNTRELLVNMATDQWFCTATRKRIKDIRMGAQELCLRYITYDRIYDAENKCFKSFGDMTDLLDRMIVKLNEMNQTEHWEIELAFSKSMEKCYALFGETATIEKSSAGYNESTNKYQYAIINDTPLDFAEEGLREYLHNHRKKIAVNAIVSIQVNKKPVGTVFEKKHFT